MNMPTVDEFKNAVEKSFRQGKPFLNDEEVKEYLFSDQYIEHMYDKAKTKYENGEITLDEFMVGEASAIAYDLEMSY